MVFFNWATMQMAAKIVYYGPGLCGKTSNLSFIYAKTAPNSRGEMVSLETESDRTLFFDLLPIEVGTIGGFKTRLQLYTVPGQVFYNTTRKLVLKGVDGLVFVADSQRPMREANIESFESLRSNLDELGIEFHDLPMVLQYNKRDLDPIVPIDQMREDLNPERRYTFFESEAINGLGVFETLKEITKLTLKKLRKRMVAPHTASAGVRPASPSIRQAPSAPKRPASVSAAALARAAEEGVDSPPVGRHATPGPEQSPRQDAPDASHQTTSAAAPLTEESPFSEESPALDPPMPTTDASVLGGDPFADVDQPSPFVDDDDGSASPASVELELAEADVADAPPVGPTDENSDVDIEFDQTEANANQVAPPPMKRVQVSNQMDILAELEGLRKQATMATGMRRTKDQEQELDIDALLAGSEETRELRRKIEQALNSDIFRNMRGLQLAIRIQNAAGETIHTLEPVSLSVDKADKLKTLSLRFTVHLENHQ
jgi:signal recognition particle receptor subunit beta